MRYARSVPAFRFLQIFISEGSPNPHVPCVSLSFLCHCVLTESWWEVACRDWHGAQGSVSGLLSCSNYLKRCPLPCSGTITSDLLSSLSPGWVSEQCGRSCSRNLLAIRVIVVLCMLLCRERTYCKAVSNASGCLPAYHESRCLCY